MNMKTNSVDIPVHVGLYCFVMIHFDTISNLLCTRYRQKYKYYPL